MVTQLAELHHMSAADPSQSERVLIAQVRLECGGEQAGARMRQSQWRDDESEK